MQAGVLDAVERACARRVSTIRLEMRRGLSSLATIASVAPFFGVIGTLTGIFVAYQGSAGSGDRWMVFAGITGRVSEALVLTGLGLFVALIAFCGREHLVSKLENLDVEMKTASLELISELARLKPLTQWPPGV
jgi:biopolymer transport protein ExbB